MCSDYSVDEKYMRMAVEAACESARHGDIPVGCVLVADGQVIAVSGNTVEQNGNAVQHAEINVIDIACRKRNNRRLSDCTMYVTMEPCPMCAGAIMSARIPKVVYGVKDANSGAYGSVFDMRAYPVMHKPTVIGGVLENECREPLCEFFENKRKTSNKND